MIYNKIYDGGKNMSTVVMDPKEEIVMKLVHYFITEENYTPMIVNGVKNEIWLENSDGPYKIVRINSNYIHNVEQYNFDIFKTNNVMRQIKKKTVSFKMNSLSIFLDINDDINLINSKKIASVSIKDEKDITKNKILLSSFPSIKNKLLKAEGDLNLLVNVTQDINKKNERDNRHFEEVFRPKKIIVTKVIVAICILLYILSMILVYEDGSSVLLDIGNNNYLSLQQGELYRLVLSAFLHVNIFHLLCNMYALIAIGSQLENFIGKTKYTLVFLGSAIVGNLFSAVISNNMSVGASGAIFGLLGAILYFGYHYRLYLGSIIKTRIIPVIIINLLLGFMMPGIDNAAHFGGLVGGYLVIMMLGLKDKTDSSEKINGGIVLTFLVAFLSYLLYTK